MNDHIVLLDDGQASGVRVERHDDERGPSWLSMEAGQLKIGINFGVDHELDGGPVALYLRTEEISGPWALDTLRQLHRDLGRLLADKHLPGALDEAWAFYNEAKPC